MALWDAKIAPSVSVAEKLPMPSLIPPPYPPATSQAHGPILWHINSAGTLRLEHKGVQIDVRPGAAIVARAGEWVRY
jgi:hypothetical protein